MLQTSGKTSILAIRILSLNLVIMTPTTTRWQHTWENSGESLSGVIELNRSKHHHRRIKRVLCSVSSLCILNLSDISLDFLISSENIHTDTDTQYLSFICFMTSRFHSWMEKGEKIRFKLHKLSSLLLCETHLPTDSAFLHQARKSSLLCAQVQFRMIGSSNSPGGNLNQVAQDANGK